jgi:hypothetical protein
MKTYKIQTIPMIYEQIQSIGKGDKFVSKLILKRYLIVKSRKSKGRSYRVY